MKLGSLSASNCIQDSSDFETAIMLSNVAELPSHFSERGENGRIIVALSARPNYRRTFALDITGVAELSSYFTTLDGYSLDDCVGFNVHRRARFVDNTCRNPLLRKESRLLKRAKPRSTIWKLRIT